jgi:hypothetical protein
VRVDEICENICEISVESMRAGSQMQVRVAINSHPHYPHYLLAELNTFSGTPELGGAGGAAAPVALHQEGKEGKGGPFNIKNCLGK